MSSIQTAAEVSRFGEKRVLPPVTERVEFARGLKKENEA